MNPLDSAKTPCKYNFSAGPSMFPKEVMTIAHQEFLNWNNTGMSVLVDVASWQRVHEYL